MHVDDARGTARLGKDSLKYDFTGLIRLVELQTNRGDLDEIEYRLLRRRIGSTPARTATWLLGGCRARATNCDNRCQTPGAQAHHVGGLTITRSAAARKRRPLQRAVRRTSLSAKAAAAPLHPRCRRALASDDIGTVIPSVPRRTMPL